jgi:hypothetical protein
MDNDDVRTLPGQDFPDIGLFGQPGYAQFPVRFTPPEEFRTAGRINQEYPDHG